MSLALLQSMGGCVASSEWTTGSTPKFFKKRSVPFGAARFTRASPNLPDKAKHFLNQRPRVQSVVCTL